MGLIAASSTRAVWARNFGFAFMALLSHTTAGERRDQPFNASLRRHYPHQVRRVCSHPASQGCWSGPLRCSEGPYSKPLSLASVSSAWTYRESEPDAVTLAFAAVDRARGKRSN